MVPTGRTLRVARLNDKTIVASNAPTPEQIHAMLDHAQSASGPFSLARRLLTGLYSRGPLVLQHLGTRSTRPYPSPKAVASPPSDSTFRSRIRPRSSPACATRPASACASSRSPDRKPRQFTQLRQLTTLLALFQQIQQIPVPRPQRASSATIPRFPEDHPIEGSRYPDGPHPHRSPPNADCTTLKPDFRRSVQRAKPFWATSFERRSGSDTRTSRAPQLAIQGSTAAL